MTNTVDSVKLSFSAGALVRKDLLNKIKDYAFKHNLEIYIDEDKGFLESYFRIRLTGETTELRAFYLAWKQYILTI